jgi:hypothetical protein
MWEENMFSVDLTFKIARREVALDKFAEALVARSLEGLRSADAVAAMQQLEAALLFSHSSQPNKEMAIMRSKLAN